MAKTYIAATGTIVKWGDKEYRPPAEGRKAVPIPMSDEEAAPYVKMGAVVVHESDVEDAPAAKPLNRMNHAELVNVAQSLGIEVADGDTKAVIIEKIEATEQ